MIVWGLLATTTPMIGTLAAVPAQAQATKSYDIPAGPLSAVLSRFIEASGAAVVYDAGLARNASSAGLKGSFGSAEALSRILAGTGLTYRQTGTDSFTLEPSPVADAGTVQLGPVRVGAEADAPTPASYSEPSATGPVKGFVAHRSATATKTDTPLIETPQAISVVTRDQMDAQNVQNLAQAIRYTPGVVAEVRGVWTLYDQFSSRGFTLDSNEFLDGLRVIGGYQATPQIDQYFLERVEVLKGPASVLFGQADPGGILNMVSKRPTDTARGEVWLQGGSYDNKLVGADVSGPLSPDGELLYRLVGLWKDTGTQVDHERSRRVAISPSLTWAPDDRTSWTVIGSYQHDPSGGFYDFLPQAGTLTATQYGRIPTSFFTGDVGYNRFKRTQGSITSLFEHRFGDVLTFRQNFRWLHSSAAINQLQLLGLEDDNRTLDRYTWNDREQADAFTLDNQLQADFATGPLTHKLLAGLDYIHDKAHEAYGGGEAPTLDILDPDYHQVIPAYPVADYAISFDQRVRQTGIYAQDQIKLDRLVLVLGGRQDWSRISTVYSKGGADVRYDDDRFTWRAGAIYVSAVGIAPYVSYSESFRPNLGSTYDGTPFKPTYGRQYEGGIKYQPTGFNTLFTLSVFDLTQTNVPTRDPGAPPGSYAQIQTGAIRSRGFELEAKASPIDRLNLTAALSDTAARVTKSNDVDLGSRPVQTPKWQASGWADYTLPIGLRMGGGVRYIGGSWADQPNVTRVPGYTLVDALLGYDLGGLVPALKGTELSVNATNLFDKHYVASCGYGTCFYGLRRQVLASIRYRW